MAGLVFLLAVAVVLTVGRERIFGLVGRRFEGNKSRMRADGAFIASLHESFGLQVGQQWFIFIEEGGKDSSYWRCVACCFFWLTAGAVLAGRDVLWRCLERYNLHCHTPHHFLLQCTAHHKDDLQR